MGWKLRLHLYQVRFSKLVHQKQLGKGLYRCFTLVNDYKWLDIRQYFIITNFHTELKPQKNVSHDMNSPTFTLCAQPQASEGPIFSKKVFYLVSSGKNEISPFLPILQIFFGSPGKFYYCPPPGTQRLIDHGRLVNHSALIRFD